MFAKQDFGKQSWWITVKCNLRVTVCLRIVLPAISELGTDLAPIWCHQFDVTNLLPFCLPSPGPPKSFRSGLLRMRFAQFKMISTKSFCWNPSWWDVSTYSVATIRMARDDLVTAPHKSCPSYAPDRCFLKSAIRDEQLQGRIAWLHCMVAFYWRQFPWSM